MFALGFISGVLVCIFCAVVKGVKIPTPIETAETIKTIVKGEPKGEIIDLKEVEKIKRSEEGFSLDDAFDKNEIN